MVSGRRRSTVDYLCKTGIVLCRTVDVAASRGPLLRTIAPVDPCTVQRSSTLGHSCQAKSSPTWGLMYSGTSRCTWATNYSI